MNTHETLTAERSTLAALIDRIGNAPPTHAQEIEDAIQEALDTLCQAVARLDRIMVSLEALAELEDTESAREGRCSAGRYSARVRRPT